MISEWTFLGCMEQLVQFISQVLKFCESFTTRKIKLDIHSELQKHWQKAVFDF